MREKIREYIKREVKRIEDGETKEVHLEGVYADCIEDVIGSMEDLDFNGWEGDYWGHTDKYSVSGGMWYGDAIIRVREDEEE